MFNVHNWVKEFVNENAQRCKKDFEKFANDKTVASWGCDVPLIEGFRIAWITSSPQHKGDMQTTFYDFVTEKEYQDKYNL